MDGQAVEVDREEVDIPLGDDQVQSEGTSINGVPNGFDPERLEQLLLQIEELKKEQHQFREEQDSWNVTVKERDDLQREVQQLRNLLMRTEEQGQERLVKTRQEYEVRMEKLARERDSMVVNYAKSENQVIVSQNQREAAEKKMRDLAKERDVLLEKIKSLNGEKTKVCSIMEAKCNELFNAQREIEKMKEEVNSREIKVRWGQNKLKSESESHKETQTKLEKSQQQVRQLKEELEEVKKICAEMKVREQQMLQRENGLNEEQLLEEKAKLIVEKQSMEEQFISYRNALKEFENLRVRHTQLVGENEELTNKLQSILKERSQQEQDIVRLKEQATHQWQTLTEAQTKLAECEGVQTQLERERDRLSKNQEELEQIRQTNLELEQGIQRCRTKEMELLEFTQRLTDKNVQLQSELTALQEKTKNADVEQGQLNRRLEEAECQLKSLQLQLKEEREHRTNDSAVWAKTVADKSRLCEDLQTQVRELNNELGSVKRKQAVNIKELTRELRVTKKRLEQMESMAERGSTGGGRTSGSQQGHGDVVSLGSRTSSSTSINTAGIEAPERESPSPTRTSPHAEHPLQRPPPSGGAAGGANDWERNALLDKMIRVQRDNARKSEKIDFLEEHVTDLVNELKKKNRLLQLYFIKEDSGVLTNEATDKHKAELAKHAGIMSSMYNQKGMDSELNLDLCLEINRKLQSVLEDTLLKNITLKENLNTLGAEVARITQDYQSLLQQSKQGAAKSKS